MNTLRNTLKQRYSQIPNELITDLNLCNGSLRVLLYLFTKPDDWNVYNKDICKQLNISEQTLTKYWKTLLASGWLKREKSRNKDGKLTGGYTYLIGNFSISIKSTEQVKSIEHSNNKPINKKETNTNGKTDYDVFSYMWNEYANKTNKSKVLKITSKRKEKIRTRCSEVKDFKSVFKVAIDKASKSSFLSKGKFFDFDWLIANDTNIIKVIEDKYKDKEYEY